MNAASYASVRLRDVLHAARMQNASDVHLRPGEPPVLRVDGELLRSSGPPVSPEELDALLAAVLDDSARSRLQHRGDAGCAYSDAAGRIRIQAYRCADGIALALRLLPRRIPALESLGLPRAVAELASRTHGLAIFAGPTGSGKTTAMAALVESINRTHAKHILTIEDPIEYEHVPDRALINQRAVGEDVASYADAVRASLRSDPDVILIGEMRDAETMHAALTAAETGHLVLTTLHTADAAQTVDRIVGTFAGAAQEHVRIQLAQTLLAIVCVRLVRRANGAGRCCAAEVLLGTDAARATIREGKTHQLRSIIETSHAAGMQTFERHLAELARNGEVAAR